MDVSHSSPCKAAAATADLAQRSQIFRAYSFSTAGYLAVQALPLLMSPRSIVNLLAAEPRATTDLEFYLSRSLGFAVLALAFLNLILSGALPIDTSAFATDQDDGTINANPYAYPTLVITTFYHALQAFYLYTQTTRDGFAFGFGAGLTVSAALFFTGVWVALFGSERSRISKRTGADKRTSNWPFNNRESAREKKKESKLR